MTTIVIVTSYEHDVQELARIVRAAGVSVLAIYSHEPYRDGVGYTPEPQMRASRGKWELESEVIYAGEMAHTLL